MRSYDADDDRVAVGATMSSSGVTYHDVPNDYHVKPGYRYTVVNKQRPHRRGHPLMSAPVR